MFQQHEVRHLQPDKKKWARAKGKEVKEKTPPGKILELQGNDDVLGGESASIPLKWIRGETPRLAFMIGRTFVLQLLIFHFLWNSEF